jgi:hypothetical protein
MNLHKNFKRRLSTSFDGDPNSIPDNIPEKCELDVETRVSIAVADLNIFRKMPPPLARDALIKIQVYDVESIRPRYNSVSFFGAAV